jgi:hypothetical protein
MGGKNNMRDGVIVECGGIFELVKFLTKGTVLAQGRLPLTPSHRGGHAASSRFLLAGDRLRAMPTSPSSQHIGGG